MSGSEHLKYLGVEVGDIRAQEFSGLVIDICVSQTSKSLTVVGKTNVTAL